MNPIKQTIKIKDHQPNFDATTFKNLLRTLKDGIYILSVELLASKRTLQQNKYLWLYYGIISDEYGDNPNMLHEYLKRALLPPRFVKILGNEVKLPGSTASLNKEQFNKYIMDIEELTKVPAPDTDLYLYSNN